MSLLVLLEKLQDLIFEAEESILIDVRVAVHINDVNKLDGLGTDDLVGAQESRRVLRAGEEDLLDVSRLALTDHGRDVDEIFLARVHAIVTSARLNLLDEGFVSGIGVSSIDEVLVLL